MFHVSVTISSDYFRLQHQRFRLYGRNTVGDLKFSQGCCCRFHFCQISHMPIGKDTDVMRREEKPTRCHCMVYCTYNMLNMFRALLCPSSGARDYMCVITAYGVQCLVAGCRGSGAGQRAICPGRGMLHDSESCKIPLPGHTACCYAPDPRQPATKHCTP